MIKKFRNRHFFFIDILLLPLSVYVSYILRLEQLGLRNFWPGFLIFCAFTSIIIPFVFWQRGIYARYWRYASIDELLLLVGSLIVGSLIATTLSLVVLWALPIQPTIPRSIPLIFFVVALGSTASPRLLIRLFVRYQRQFNDDISYETVAVMGAGDAGAMIVREIRNNPRSKMDVIALLDDDPSKHNVHIHGVRVAGGRYAIADLANKYNLRKLIIAMPTTAGKEIRKIVQLCEKAHVQPQIVPGIYELLDGTVNISQIRDVQIEDLLRRAPVKTDIQKVRELVEGKRVLVTGSGGSIGGELCRQILRCRPNKIILLGHGENSIFSIFHELKANKQPSTEIVPVIADIRFAERVQAIFKEHQPDIVFHAAAHKHVPLMEWNPSEAITNNVFGTKNLVDAALMIGVHNFVMISTDKAVNPTSIMGASKRAAELVVHRAAHRSGNNYVAVRFGNVLGSRGSVVLTFQRQIAQGGPVTVTHPEMKRFFMTIPEAVQLVLQASVLGHGGEVFVLDMGEPVKIVDLARDLIELSGLEVGRDIDINYIGMRPGEKMYEELFITGEEYRRTRHEKIFIAQNASRFVPEQLDQHLEDLQLSARKNDRYAISHALKSLIPEYDVPAEQITTR